MRLPPPHRTASRPDRAGARAARDPDEARDAIAEVVRVTLLDDSARQDRRDDLAARARVLRLGFLAQAIAEITPPEPVPAGQPHPRAPHGTARYRATVDSTGMDRHRDPTFRTDLST